MYNINQKWKTLKRRSVTKRTMLYIIFFIVRVQILNYIYLLLDKKEEKYTKILIDASLQHTFSDNSILKFPKVTLITNIHVEVSIV